MLHVTTSDISLALLLGNQLLAFREAGFDVVGASAPGPFVPHIAALGIRHIPLTSATRASSIRADLKAARELRTIIRELRPDIVHTHNPKPGIYGRFVARMTGVPVVVNTVHGLYATREDGLLRRAAVYSIERLAASMSHAELVQNQEDLLTLRRLGVPSRRLHLLGNGIDLTRFRKTNVDPEARRRVRAELRARDDSIVVTTVGRLVGEKGLREFIAAGRELQISHPNAIFAIVGPTEPSKADRLTEAELEAAADAGIRIMGHRTDIDTVYAASDIFVLASHREGFPRSAMEASAMALPVIATRIRGCREVVDDGVTGILVPVRDATSLCIAIDRLLADPLERARMGKAGTQRAHQHFDEDTIIQTTLSVYHELMRSRANRPQRP